MARTARNRAQPLAELIEGCIAPSLAAQGFASSDILLAWPDIVGANLATFTQPMKLEWPRRRASYDPEERPQPGSLVIRVESAFALELQHLAPLVIEKVNTYFGWKCVGKLVLKQGPVHKAEKRKKALPRLPDGELARIDTAVSEVVDSALRDALNRLGKNVLATNRASKSL